MKRFAIDRTLRTVIIYVLFAEAWILFSDRALEMLVSDPQVMGLLQTAKGGLFVAITAVLLYVLIRGHVGRLDAQTRAAQNARTFLYGVIDASPSVIIGVDEAGAVTLWNRAARDATGIEAREARGMPLAEAFPHPALGPDAVRRVAASGISVRHEKVPRSVDGETRHENVAVYALPPRDAPGAVIRVDDVTETARMEAVLAQSEKMLSVGGLAAGMAHEINNPLAGIVQSAQSLRRRLTSDIPANQEAARATGCDPETLRAYLERRSIPRLLDGIDASVERAAAVVTDMLALGTPVREHLVPAAPADIVDKALERLRADEDLGRALEAGTLCIERDVDPRAPTVRCSPGELERAVSNLLRNAAQASLQNAAEGQPAVVRVRAGREGDWAVLRVRDQGPGMDEETRHRVFDPFYTTRAPGKGTGLGLSVAYFIVAGRHGGRLDVESEPGRGSTFVLRLPTAQDHDLTRPPS